MDDTYKEEIESLDVVFTILADQRRRYTLNCLKEQETPLTLTKLAEEIIFRENSTYINEFPSEEVNQVSLSLYHNHLPRMEDANIIHYCQTEDAIIVTEITSVLKQYVEILEAV